MFQFETNKLKANHDYDDIKLNDDDDEKSLLLQNSIYKFSFYLYLILFLSLVFCNNSLHLQHVKRQENYILLKAPVVNY